MLGASDIAAVLGAAPPEDCDETAAAAYVRALCRAGLAVLFIVPGTKEPVDLRSGQARTKDDRAAQEAARLEGRAGWDRIRSRAGVHLATTDAAVATRYLKAYRKRFPNRLCLAIACAASRVVVVDADTPDQVAGFMTDTGAPEGIAPTVTSPGVLVDGEWVHHGGGHWWFRWNEGEFDPTQGAGSIVAPGGYAIMWGNRYVLIPPSTRSEGPYVLTGREYPLSGTVIAALVAKHGATRAAAARHAAERRGTDADEALSRWSHTVGWAELLEPLGWTAAARPDSCGCPTWTAPGDHASPKSATAHEAGCSLGVYADDDLPLHIWTDNPGDEVAAFIATRNAAFLASATSGLDVDLITGQPTGSARVPLSHTLQKIHLAAIAGYGGDMHAACNNLGINPDLSFDGTVPPFDGTVPPSTLSEGSPANLDATNPFAALLTAVTAPAPEPEIVAAPVEDPFETVGGGTPPPAQEYPQSPPDPVAEEEPVPDPDVLVGLPGMPTIAPFDYWRNLPPVEYAIEGLIEQQGLTCIIGSPGVGKSTLALDLACHLVTGQRWQGLTTTRQRVVYLPGEGVQGVASRIRAWEQAHGMNVGRDLLMGDGILQLAADPANWVRFAEYLVRQQVSMVVFDTYARMAGGLDENSAKDAGRAIARLDQLSILLSAGILLVHHTGKAGDHARGSSALNGAMDTELLVSGSMDPIPEEAPVGYIPIEMRVTKQKNAAAADPVGLALIPMHGGVVVTGRSGVVGDVLDSAEPVRRRTPEPLVLTITRLGAFVAEHPQQGVTRADIAAGLEWDDYTRFLPTDAASKAHWKTRVNRAVDAALRHRYITTLTGTPTNMRYVRGDATEEDLRQRLTAEAIDVDAGAGD